MAAYPDFENPAYTSGGVPYEFLFENYLEQTNIRAENSLIKARIYWEDRDQFVSDVLGQSTGTGLVPNMLNRVLPLAHPTIPNLWCTDLKLVDYASSVPDNSNQFGFGQDPSLYGPNGSLDLPGGQGMFQTDWAIYALTFSRLPYFLLTNSQVSDRTVPEINRYCIIGDRPRAREFTVKAFGLAVEADPDKVLPLPSFVMDREQDLFVTIIQFPADKYPSTAIDACLGRVNDAILEIPVAYFPPDQIGTRSYAIGTLLFRGVATEVTPYPGPNGYWYRDIPYFFTYRPTTWRKLPNPAGDGEPVTMIYANITPAKYLYNLADFTKLFKPEP